MKPFMWNSPIVIGGIGGSGTRIVADILIQAGVYLGNKLNHSLDNLWFTGLLKRIDLFEKNENQRETEIQKGLDIFTTIMVGGPTGSQDFLRCLREYSENIKTDEHGNNAFHDYFNNCQNVMEEMQTAPKPCQDESFRLGWKEPNSHIFLKDLVQYYSGMKYIHVLRHGLDMAYSMNQNQVKLWGFLYDIESTGQSSNPKTSFRYWLRANQTALERGRKMLADRYIIMKYEDICERREKEITRLVRFLQLAISNETLDQITHIPVAQPSIGRYKNHDVSWVTDDDITSLKIMGYEC